MTGTRRCLPWLIVAFLVGCAPPPPPRPTPTIVRVAATATPIPSVPTTASDFLPTAAQIPTSFVYVPERDRVLTQPTLSGLLRSYTRQDAAGHEGLVQLGVTLADTPETATLVFASTMNNWVQQGYQFEPLVGLGELAVVGRRTTATAASTQPDSIIIYFRRGNVDAVVLWSDAGLPPLEDKVMDLARHMDARAQANPQPALP
jgi:hypothetical protein